MKLNKYVVLIILMALIFFAFYNFILKNQIQKVKELNLKIDEANAKLDELLNIKKNEDKIKFLLDENKNDIEELRSILPIGENLPILLTQFNQVEKDLNIVFNSLNFVGGVSQQAGNISSSRLMVRDDYYEMKVTFSITSDYETFMKLLDRLENFPRILGIRKISVSSQRQTFETEKVNSHNYNLEIYIFSAKEP
ncbi:MAG TPA: type 4a pilus biogenesis protein PilO [Caldisericia bacterium]|nr:type 4a pilus biogenesis protein PilO [Caldisericia bacterium]